MNCPHGFPKPENCYECLYEGNVNPPPPKAKPQIEAVFIATFDGHCKPCDLPINVGQRIARLDHGGYVHFPDCT